MCRATATEELSYLFIPNSRNCSRVKSNAVSFLTVFPSLCSVFQAEDLLYRKWSNQCWLNISWKLLLDQILFKYFALFTVASDCALGFGVDEQLDDCPFGRLVSCPQYTRERLLVEVVVLISEWQQLRERSRWF